MKYTIITLAILLLATIGSTAQYHDNFRDKPPAAIYIAYQPTDHGLGLRGDYHINHWAGVYGSASYGQWRLYKWSGLDKHIKATLGVLIPIKDWMGNQHDVSVGLNHHWVSGEIVDSELFHNDKAFDNPWSFELGLTIKYPRFAIAIRTDILRWEPGIDIGIPLNFNKESHDYRDKMPKKKQASFYI